MRTQALGAANVAAIVGNLQTIKKFQLSWRPPSIKA
jgi:hypothetical protein